MNQLFDGEDINVRNIMKKMSDEKFRVRQNVDDFCRLTILLSFVVFYFPRSYKNIRSFPFRLLDNLDALHMYNWGGAVHESVVSSITRASKVYYQQKNPCEIYLVGCVAVLQVCSKFRTMDDIM